MGHFTIALMTNSDLVQIKELFTQALLENNKNLVTKDYFEDFAAQLRGEMADMEERIMTRVQNQFSIIDFRFASMDQKFDAIDRKFDAIDRKFDAIDKRLEGVDNRLDGLMTKQDFFKWVDNFVVPIKQDTDRLKYLHQDNWKKLPAIKTIRKALSAS